MKNQRLYRRVTLILPILILYISVFCVSFSNEIAIAPSTLGGAIINAGKFTNTLKETRAWKTLTSHPNALVRMFPVRAMQMVRQVVRSFRKETLVIVDSPVGKLKGRYQKYKSGETGGYYSFKGIRYGQAPVGNRRFRAALPEEPWKNVRNALQEGNSCPHINLILNTFKGSEDCLFLNVFTKRLPRGNVSPNYPVMFWIHGGGYAFGSGNTFLYGPDFLVAEDVLVVTINYRLGALGFLSAGPSAPGNAGLKDQVLALKWVQKNIAAFGGNPNSVTIFGESAGGSSAQFHILSPMSKGLFHRAISESGSALNPWSLADNSTGRAFRLGDILGFRNSSTEDLLQFLRQVPFRKIVEAVPLTISEEDIRRNIGLPFVPVIEGLEWVNDVNESETDYMEEPFINEQPLVIYKRQEFNKVPYITGFNTHEAMVFVRRLRKNPNLLEILDNDFSRLIPSDLELNGFHEDVEYVTQKMRDFYLGSRNVSTDTIEEMIFLFTDIMFIRGIMKTVRLHSIYSKMPLYMYRFAFDGALGLYKRMLAIPRSGVCHGDELGYLFQFGFFNLSLDPLSSEALVKNRMVKMWTNFAKYGEPTPSEEGIDPILPIKWDPVANFDITKVVNYLDITSRLEMRVNPERERLSFWDNMYMHYNGNVM